MIVGKIARFFAPDEQPPAWPPPASPHELCSPYAWPVDKVCKVLIASPFWSAVTIGDIVCLWFILCILWRASTQAAEHQSARQSLSKNVRARRFWGTLRTTLRLASARRARSGETWSEAWEGVGKARGDRKSHMLKLDFNLGAVTTRAIGPVFVCFVTSLILFEAHAFFTLALPWYELDVWQHRAVQALGACVFGRIFFDYARTSLTDPGSPAPTSASGLVARQPSDPELAGRVAKKDPHWCDACKGPKPPRAHHCKTCRRCVLQMDHHCPFVSNCVGERNYSYFCLFLLDLTVGCFLLALALSSQVPRALLELYFDTLQASAWSRNVYVLSVFLVATGAMVLVGSLLAYHVHLIATGETTLEQMKRHAGKGGRRDGGKVDALKGFSAVFGAPPSCLRGTVKKSLELIANID